MKDGRHWVNYGLAYLAIAALFMALIAFQVHTSYEAVSAVTFTNESLDHWRVSTAVSLVASLLFLAIMAAAIFRLYADISARRQAELALTESRQRFDLAVRGSADGIWDWNIQTGETYVSERWCQMLGYRPEEIHFGLKGWTGWIHPEDRDAALDLMRQHFRTKNPYVSEYRMRTRSGEYRWYLNRGQAVWNDQGRAIRVAGSTSDINERKQIEAQLKEHQTRLEELVRQRTAELTRALETAQLADRSKDEFLANISHELRTPLNAVIGLADLARNIADDPKLCEYLNKIVTSGKHLARIINDLLDLSKIAAGYLEFEAITFSLRSLAGNSSVMSHKAEEKGLILVESIDDDVPDILLGDPLRLQQIIFNLLSNAIKFTPAGRVDIRIGLHKREADRVCLEIVVTDTGIGIKATDLERLFKPFSQADASMSRNYGGTGLGLAISRRLAEMMEGEISVESQAGHGTTFRVQVWFQLGDAADMPDARPLSDLESLPLRYRNTQVLVVEDQPMNREIVEELLDSVGITVRLAGDGQEALDILAEAGPGGFDLILMDIQMPVMDGLAATRAIRRQTGYALLPIIALSAHTMKHEIEAGTAAGINDHIGKPFDTVSFYRMLKKWLPHSRRESPAASLSPAVGKEGEIRGIDTKAGLALFAGNQGRYQYWLTQFVANAPDCAAEIRRFLASGQHEKARQCAHAFKGRTGMLGMKQLHPTVAALEAALQQELPTKELLAQVERAVTQTCHEIRAALGPARQASSATAISGSLPPTALAQNDSPITASPSAGLETWEKPILLIDDDPAVLETLNQCLRPHYPTRDASQGRQGLALARVKPMPSLILLDVELPDMTGYEVCAALKQDELTAAIPVIFLSSHYDVGDITHGLKLGAVDYVAKPVAPPILLARVQTQLRLRESTDLLRDQNAHLEFEVGKRTRDLRARTLELQSNQELTIFALGSIAETRDNETGNHIHRTSAYVEILTNRLATLPSYRDHAAKTNWELIWKSAPLHDIGKVGIPDQILLKPGKLNATEFEIMKRHTVLGRDAIRAAEIRVNTPVSFLRMASEIAYSHHERWDGGGYPEGLRGETIPLAARLMAVADVYDALISVRVYKPKLDHAEAIEIIRAGSGSHFDPVIVDCFIEVADKFHSIADKFSDVLGE